MSVKYNVIERVNPRDITLPRKFYANIKYGDDVKFNDLVGLISQFSTINQGDIHGVIQTLLHVIPYELNFGRSIHLGDFGTFYLTLESDGKESEDEFYHSDIKRAKLRFRPGMSVKKMLKTLEFERVEPPGS
jgi:predicted histone-like DNA-binding protein